MTPPLIRNEVSKIRESEVFRRSKMLGDFLEFIVEKTLTDETDSITEFAIATEVYKRPATFDPSVDNIVRSEIGRLRKKLAAYYERNPSDPIRVSVPKGGYCPKFTPRRSCLSRFFQRSEEFDVDQGAQSSVAGSLILLACFGLVCVLLLKAGEFGASELSSGSGLNLRVWVLDTKASGAAVDSLAHAVSYEVAKKMLRIEGLTVSGIQDKGSAASPGLSGRSPAYEVGGSVEERGAVGEFLVSLNLMRGEDRATLWSAELDGNRTEVFEKLRTASGELEGVLKSEITRQDGEHKLLPTSNLRAYRAFLSGQSAFAMFMRAFDSESKVRAEEYFRKALEFDPGLVEAYVQLANLKLWSIYPPGSPESRSRSLQEAEGALDKASRLDPENAQVLALKGRLMTERGEPLDGAALALRAVTRQPQDPITVRSLAWTYSALGFYEEALRLQEQGRSSDPASISFAASDSFLRARIGRIDEAAHISQAFLTEYPDLCLFGDSMAEASFWARDFKGAERYARDSLACKQVGPDEALATGSILMVALAAQGTTNEIESFVRRHADLSPFVTDFYLLAWAYAGDAETFAARVREHPKYSNYRWLISAPLPASVFNSPQVRDLAADLYVKWQKSLVQWRDNLQSPPPDMPSPAEVFSKP